MRSPAVALLALLLAAPSGGASAAPAVTSIQPGAEVIIGANGCTMNFVFRDASEKLYIGTAGHCGNVGQRARTRSPNREFGTVVYSENQEAPGIDFALIRIDHPLYGEVQPAVRDYGGPVGYTTETETETLDMLLLTGYGLGFGETDLTRPRIGFLITDDRDEYVADMISVNGDSGGPVLHADTGKALGTISRFNIPISTDIGPTVEAILKRVRNAGVIDLTLVTAAFQG